MGNVVEQVYNLSNSAKNWRVWPGSDYEYVIQQLQVLLLYACTCRNYLPFFGSKFSGGGVFFFISRDSFPWKKKINLCQEWYNADEYSIWFMWHRVPSFSLALFDIVKVIYNFHRHLPSPFTSDKKNNASICIMCIDTAKLHIKSWLPHFNCRKMKLNKA